MECALIMTNVGVIWDGPVSTALSIPVKCTHTVAVTVRVLASMFVSVNLDGVVVAVPFLSVSAWLIVLVMVIVLPQTYANATKDIPLPIVALPTPVQS
jgi:hypothetical protein